MSVKDTHNETNSLHHYCKLAIALDYILPNRQLLLNPLGKANDPRENKSFVFRYTNIDDSEYFNWTERNSEITQGLRKDCKVLCLFSNHYPYFGFEYSRLWALYGENHKGICIGLDKNKFLNENREKINQGLFKEIFYQKLNLKNPQDHKEIDYDRIRALKQDKYLKNEFRPEHMDFLFFTKNDEWESEHEYRVLYFSDKAVNEYCTIADCISGIYLGVDFDYQHLPKLKMICSNIPIYKLEFIENLRLTDRLIRS